MRLITSKLISVNLKNFAFFLISLLIVSLFIVKGVIGLDPDFGWRLRTGYLILSQGLPKADPYTYTMPSFPWVDHAWVIDAAIALIDSFFGMVGLAIAASVFVFAALVVSASVSKKGSQLGEFLISPWLKKVRLGYLGNFVFLLSVTVLLPFSGVRAQVVTWFMLAVFLKVLLDKGLWHKYKAFIPLFFIVWTNLHGGFAAGLATLALVLLVRLIKERKINVADWVVLIFSVLASFINPYGKEVWREVWSSFSDTKLRWTISEWGPALLNFDVSAISLLCLSTTFVVIFRKKIQLEEIVLFFVFLLQGLGSIRQIPLWVIVALPLTSKAIRFFYQDISGNKVSVRMFKKAYTIAWVSSWAIFVLQAFLAFQGSISLSEKYFYPKEAVAFVKQNPPQGQIFSEYGWGGYLIWKLPEKKVFIDGRMPSWRWKADIANETNSTMDDYVAILKGERDYKEVFDKYNIEMVLWPKPKAKGVFDYLENLLDNRLDFVYELFGIENRGFELTKELEKEGWEKVYEDQVAVIYVE